MLGTQLEGRKGGQQGSPKTLCQAGKGRSSAFSPGKPICLHPVRTVGKYRSLRSRVPVGGGAVGSKMESLTESGVLWSLLLEQDSQPLQWYLRKLADVPAGTELCYWPGSEEIPAVSVRPNFSVPV